MFAVVKAHGCQHMVTWRGPALQDAALTAPSTRTLAMPCAIYARMSVGGVAIRGVQIQTSTLQQPHVVHLQRTCSL